MAIKKKSEHYTAPQGYRDLDGMSKSFTVIDYDKHKTRTKMGRETNIQKEEKALKLKELEEVVKKAKEETIESILALPAVSALRNAYLGYDQFVISSKDTGVIWNEEVVRQACMINAEMGRTLFLHTWRYTVREAYWFETMPLEDLKAQKWRDWM